MGSSREYWRYARQCARWAKESQSKEDHDVMVDMAKAWVHLAMVDMDVVAEAGEAIQQARKSPLNS
jgi:hypothetical protein